MDDEEIAEAAGEMLKAVEHEVRRYELALLSYEGQFRPISESPPSPYPREPFTLLPLWQQEMHYRVADLVLAHGYKKIG